MKSTKWKLASTPAETIRRTVESMGMDIDEIAMRGLLPMSHFRRVVAGAAEITADIWQGMARVLGERCPFYDDEDEDFDFGEYDLDEFERIKLCCDCDDINKTPSMPHIDTCAIATTTQSS